MACYWAEGMCQSRDPQVWRPIRPVREPAGPASGFRPVAIPMFTKLVSQRPHETPVNQPAGQIRANITEFVAGMLVATSL